MTKAITSTAILTLHAAGKLGIDDLVFGAGKLFGTTYGTKPYSAWLKEITIRHLLTHTAGGWPNDGNDPMFFPVGNQSLDHTALITWVLDNLPLANEPGKAYAYSNFGYCLLGRVIEKVTKQPYDAWVNTNVLAKAGIEDMQIAGNTLAQRAANEVVYSGTGSPYGWNVTRMDSHGGWIATPVDLLRFAVRVDGFPAPPDLLDATNLNLQTTPTTVSIDPKDQTGYGHSAAATTRPAPPSFRLRPPRTRGGTTASWTGPPRSSYAPRAHSRGRRS